MKRIEQVKEIFKIRFSAFSVVKIDRKESERRSNFPSSPDGTDNALLLPVLARKIQCADKQYPKCRIIGVKQLCEQGTENKWKHG